MNLFIPPFFGLNGIIMNIRLNITEVFFRDICFYFWQDILFSRVSLINRGEGVRVYLVILNFRILKKTIIRIGRNDISIFVFSSDTIYKVVCMTYFNIYCVTVIMNFRSFEEGGAAVFRRNNLWLIEFRKDFLGGFIFRSFRVALYNCMIIKIFICINE